MMGVREQETSASCPLHFVIRKQHRNWVQSLDWQCFCQCLHRLSSLSSSLYIVNHKAECQIGIRSPVQDNIITIIIKVLRCRKLLVEVGTARLPVLPVLLGGMEVMDLLLGESFRSPTKLVRVLIGDYLALRRMSSLFLASWSDR